MKFGKDNKVKIETMNKEQASAFVTFLESEILRHQEDIEDAEKLIQTVKEKFNL